MAALRKRITDPATGAITSTGWDAIESCSAAPSGSIAWTFGHKFALAMEQQFCISLNRLLSYEASKLLSLKEFELLSNQLKR
jgi:hypothetical protein